MALACSTKRFVFFFCVLYQSARPSVVHGRAGCRTDARITSLRNQVAHRRGQSLRPHPLLLLQTHPLLLHPPSHHRFHLTWWSGRGALRHLATSWRDACKLAGLGGCDQTRILRSQLGHRWVRSGTTGACTFEGLSDSPIPNAPDPALDGLPLIVKATACRP